jgi:hypothetical protein
MENSNIKPGDLVRVYNYTNKRREAMPSTYSVEKYNGHKFGLIVREYPDDSYFPPDYELFGGSSPDPVCHDREWYVLLSGGCQAGEQIIVNENRLEKV